MTTLVAEAPPTVEPPALDRAHALHLLREMVRIRRFEDKCAELYSAGKIRGFMHLCNGEEAVDVGTMIALTPEDDIVATYREHGQALARGMSAGSIMAEMFGKQEGCSRGRGGSMHLYDAATRFYGGNAIVAGGLPLSLGFALAAKTQRSDRITVCYFGDGAVAEGEFHETLNLAALWKLPLLLLCENNLYAMGTAIERALSVTNVSKKAEGYAIPAERVDGMDVLVVEEATRRAADFVRAGNGPYLLEFLTYRFRPHSMFDAELYRAKDEVARWREQDPIPRLADRLRLDGLLDDAEMRQIEAEADAEVQAAVDFAEAGTWEPVEELTRFVYSERSRS